MSFRTILLTLALALISGITLASTAAFAAPDDAQKAETDVFFPSSDVMKDVDDTLARAKENNKLALIVLGADWCHDSRALVSNLNNPAMKDLLDENYEVTLVDVEFFEHGLDVVRRFGQPTIFATPTVLIVDPKSGKLVNSHNMHQFKDAEAMGLEKTLGYLYIMRSPENHTSQISADSNAPAGKLLHEISAFEAKQAERIETGFQQMVPYLKVAKKDRPKKFYDLWFELRDLRYSIADDMAALRKQALERTKAGETDVVLTYPIYKSFSWE